MTKKTEVWVVDDDQSIRWVLEQALRKRGYVVHSFSEASSLLKRLQQEQPAVVLSDVRMPEMDGLALMQQIKAQHPRLPVIIMTAYSDLESTVSAYQEGAFDYLAKPFDLKQAVDLVGRAIDHADDAETPPVGEGVASSRQIIGSAPAMQEVFRSIGRLSSSHITVLITGESGSGKELVAEALHRHSPRAGKPFIALNMAAIPQELMESELFGHERGAFTGAVERRRGRFEQADGGTLFLDEIGDMPAALQSRLLRVLAEGAFYRVGGHAPLSVDVRIIAATHQDLEARVGEGLFREDLWHRLNVIRVHVPPLRERREDIGLLAKFFLETAARELNVPPKILRDKTLGHLVSLPWPGNVRELLNVCRWLTVMAPGEEIHRKDLPPELTPGTGSTESSEDWESALRHWAEFQLAQGTQPLLDSAASKFERVLIETTLKFTDGRRQDAAKLLGWGRNTLTRKIRELDL